LGRFSGVRLNVDEEVNGAAQGVKDKGIEKKTGEKEERSGGLPQLHVGCVGGISRHKVKNDLSAEEHGEKQDKTENETDPCA
jgi:hypothetical protein